MPEQFDAARLTVARVAMARRVTASAGLESTWAAAFRTVPREAFIPDRVWDDDDQGRPVAIKREQDPDTWYGKLYHEGCAIGTQLDDGADDGPGRYTSSSSTPEVMARMLAELPAAGARVLEVGTGTGYGAALLATGYGPQNVTTVDVDAFLAERAGKALAAAGYPVTVACGDGVDGLSQTLPGATFDALICTCSIAHVPAGWLAAVPDGVIVAPWYSGWLPPGLLILNTAPGGATGRFKPNASFMRARAHRWEADRPADDGGGRERCSPLSPHLLTSSPPWKGGDSPQPRG